MFYQSIVFSLFLMGSTCVAQEFFVVKGKVLNESNKTPLKNIMISLDEGGRTKLTDSEGDFRLQVQTKGDYILHISFADFITKRIPIAIESKILDVGTIYIERDIATDQIDNLITLTDSEVLDDEISSNSAGILQATKDIFLNRAAFDFGQAFFRVRGYDSQYGKVLLNGIPMNKFYDGRPQWNNWGGLNDATRNQQFTHGLQPSEYNFGGILGTTNIDTRPSKFRPGTRLSSSASNRTYAGRLMVTHTSKTKKNGLSYSISASRRWANQGYINGTLYDAYSIFGALEYMMNEKNSFNLTAILASNRRGRSSALTEEVFELVGKKYNPYWGLQNDEIRNSRERKIAEPILMLNHYFVSKKFKLNTGVSYQLGTNYRSRLGYYNAPNPDPIYYRYLPSFYVNSPIGANFISANAAKEGFLQDPQWSWSKIYQANTNADKASYILYDDVTNDKQLTLNTIGNVQLTKTVQIDFGVTYRQLKSNNYAKIHDLLGANFHEDIDPFSNTLNDVNGNMLKEENDVFNYHFDMNVSHIDAFAQFKYFSNKWDAFLSTNYSNTNYQRDGRFQNGRFIENSIGKSKPISLPNFGSKAGLTYRINGRHQLVVNGIFLRKPPALQNTFINPRENNEIVSNLQNERISSTDFNYYLRLPKLTGRFSAFYTRFQNTTDVNFFFVDSGLGSDFVQEVLTDLDKLHKGFELGFEYELSSSVKLTAVAALGEFIYASDPSVAINFDTAGAEEEVLNLDGNIDLGIANIKGYKLAQGPQKAFALGINYRAPKYWWVGATANYLASNYANISTITRTASFYLDPESGEPFPEATDENVRKLLAQKPLDNFYLLNLVGGKSWLKKGKYISVFASINNVFDANFRTGGYEQSRNGNYGQLAQDNLSGTPSFAPKYWYGYGRTYFLNVAFSF